MRGRKPLPSNVHKLRGNPGKRKRAPEPEGLVAEAIKPPRSLSSEAKKVWKRLVAQLDKGKLVTELDERALMVLCDTIVRYEDAMDHLRDDGYVVTSPKGFPMQSPYLQIVNKAQDQMVRMMTEFGMTPSSRTRVSPVTGSGSGDPTADELFGSGAE